MRPIKFRAWNDIDKMMIEWDTLQASPVLFMNILKGKLKHHQLMQFTGLQDSEGVDIYVGCIGEFSNGDRFIVSIESWLEVYIKWVGEPECEDQARDLYRISNAKIIGTIHQNPELLELDK